ncbi:ABC transporter permease [Planctomycetota bacterium]|nr:ABC transporter permease [Planctomycetota bacterium]
MPSLPKRNVVLGLIGILGFFAVWQVATWRIHNAVLLPGPLAMFEALCGLCVEGRLWGDIGASLRRVVVGFLIASAVAVPLALALAASSLLRGLLLPIVTFLRPIPPIAWIPLAILWFGLGDPPSFYITAVAAFFPIFINSFSGAATVEADHLNAARCLGAERWALLMRIFLPSALPSIWTGLRIGLGQSWMAVVTAELITAQSGLGYLIQLSRLNLDTDVVIVGMCVIGFIGALMTATLSYVERWVMPWRHRHVD